MWKDYLAGYIKNNRASGVSVRIATIISALLLSLLCSLFYNLWIYEIERIKAEEGNWEARLTGAVFEQELAVIKSQSNVEWAALNETLSEKDETTIDICLKNRSSIFTDMPRIAEQAGLDREAISYHASLLNMYLIKSPGDTALRWVFPFFLLVTAAACLSLILVIHNAFAVTMQSRIHQFGILVSIGATPGQIRTGLLQEAAWLCALPVVFGNLAGVLIAMGTINGMNLLTADIKRRLALPFSYHPMIFVLSLLAAVVTIWISAWIPAGKISRMTPLEAIKNTGDLHPGRKTHFCILSALFGVEGELAQTALKTQKKSLRTAFVSLVFAFLAFFLLMCFFTVTQVSQRETYFEKYQYAWDVMATVEDTRIDAFEQADAIKTIPGIKSSVVYQKAKAKRLVMPQELHAKMQKIGGFQNASAEYVSAADGGWLVNAPLVILDDTSFLEYLSQIGAQPDLYGAVIRNVTRDALDPNFRKRRTLPYLKEDGQTTVLRQAEGEDKTVEIPVLKWTDELPVLREEYGTLDFYELVHFISASCWKEIKNQIGGSEEDITIRILAEDRDSLAELDAIEHAVSQLLGNTYQIETENRIQDRIDNDKMMTGMKAVLSVFCILLAMIGIGNIFSNAFGFVRQRKREFARLLSIGMTPAQMKKVFCIEALVIAGKPVLITAPLTAAAVFGFIKMSYLEPMLFIREIPFVPMFVFVLTVFGFVGLAYFLGARKVMRSDLADALRDDTVM